MRESDCPDGKRAEEQRGEPRIDKPLGSEDPGVREAELQQTYHRQPEPLRSAQSWPSTAKSYWHQDQRGHGHPDAGEKERWEIRQADLDHQPGGSPQHTADDVEEERAARHFHALKRKKMKS